jgi:hypothetical protein
MRSRHLLTRAALALASASLGLAVTPASAQDGQMPPWLDVAIVQVKPASVPAFEDLMRDFLHARREAGLPTGQVFQVVLGNANEYHFVAPVQSIAAGMQSAPPMSEVEWATWIARIMGTVDSVKFFYAATYPQHGVAPPENAAEPTMMLLRKVNVTQGKEAEYEAWVAEQYMPAFRETNPLGHVMSRGVYGDSLQHYYHAYPIAGPADLDGADPLLGVLGQRRYDQVFDELDGIITDHEMVVARMRGDLAE